MKITTDKSKQITILSRVDEPGLPIVFEFLENSLPFDITSLAFKYIATRLNGTTAFECTVGDGLTIQDTNKLTLQLTALKIADVKPGILFFRLVSVTENNTWLNGYHKFHNKTFDGVLTSSVDIEINNDGTTVEIAVTTGGVGVSQNLAQVLAQGNDGNGEQIKNIADPTEDQDAATKKYVDDNSGGGGGAVDSVTGDGVNNTDPANPVINWPTLQQAIDKGGDVNNGRVVRILNVADADSLVEIFASDFVQNNIGEEAGISFLVNFDTLPNLIGTSLFARAGLGQSVKLDFNILVPGQPVAIFTDNRSAKVGLQYGPEKVYDEWTDDTLVDKGFVQRKFSTKVVDTTTYTVIAGDIGKQLLLTNVAGCAVTFPNGLAQDFICEFVRKGGEVTFAATGTLQSKGNTLATQYTAAVAVHEGSNVWGLYGELT